MRLRSRGALRPSFAEKLPALQSEGAGKTGCALHPRSRVRIVLSRLHTSIQGSGEHPAFPAQWLYGLWRALPGRAVLVVTVAGGIPPASLTPAYGASQDHTLLPYAFAALVRQQHRRPPRPVPRRDDGQRPSEWDGMDRVVALICHFVKEKYILFWGLTRLP